MAGDGSTHAGWSRSPLVGIVLAFAAGEAVWGAWLGWDDEYYWDESMGAFQGPYRTSQVLGCALTFAVAGVLMAMRWNPFAVGVGLAGGFWVAWTLHSATTDETGLYLVGALMLGPPLVVGGLLAALLGSVVSPRAGHPRHRLKQ